MKAYIETNLIVGEDKDKLNEHCLGGITFPVLTDRYTREGKRRKLRYILISFGSFLLVTLVFILLFRAYQIYGRSRLQTSDGPDIVSLQASISELGLGDEYDEMPEDYLIYKGQLYKYNSNIMTFLILGIDSHDGIGQEKRPIEAGQADVIILAVLDEEAKTFKMINISRDIMVPIQTYDQYGMYTGYHEMQLALQYAYGEGREHSIELMEETVSTLFYGIPIHGSGAMAMQAIEILNDAVDGVTLYVIEDLSIVSPQLNYGNTITLIGSDALHYVRYRNIDIFGSNYLRNARQKQYILAFYHRIREKTRENLTIPLRLYGIVKDHVLTSITADQIAYLSTAILGISFTEEDMVSVAGVITKPDYHEEFRVDEEELIELIIDIFYLEVR